MSLPYFNTSLIPPVGTDPTALANGNALVDRLHVAIAQLAPFDRLSDADDTLGLGGGGASAPGSAYAQLAQLFPPSTGAAASPNAGAAGAPLGGGFGTLPPGRLGGPVTPEQRQGLIDGLGRSLPDLSRGWPACPICNSIRRTRRLRRTTHRHRPATSRTVRRRRPEPASLRRPPRHKPRRCHRTRIFSIRATSRSGGREKTPASVSWMAAGRELAICSTNGPRAGAARTSRRRATPARSLSCRKAGVI